jgi:hypothetical protein
MANAMIAQSINRQIVAAALREVRLQAQEHQAWITAINKAAVELEGSSWAFDGEVLRVASRTSNRRYMVDAHGHWACKAAQAGRICWHRAAWRRLCKAAEMVPAPRVELTEAELAAMVEELYG